MDLFEAIKTRTSVRQYDSVKISEADLTKILDAGRRAPSGSNRQPLQYVLIQEPKTLKALERVQPCFATASAAIGVIGDPGVSRWWLEDASAATENMLLAIHALGYASVWVEGTLLKEEDFARELLGVPKEKRLIVLLPIGKAPQKTPQADKKPLKEILWKERYGRR
jgi:nitroreductase